MNTRTSLLVVVLKPFVALYKLLSPRGGQRGFIYFILGLLTLIVAGSIVGNVVTKKNNVNNSSYDAGATVGEITDITSDTDLTKNQETSEVYADSTSNVETVNENKQNTDNSVNTVNEATTSTNVSESTKNSDNATDNSVNSANNTNNASAENNGGSDQDIVDSIIPDEKKDDDTDSDANGASNSASAQNSAKAESDSTQSKSEDEGNKSENSQSDDLYAFAPNTSDVTGSLEPLSAEDTGIEYFNENGNTSKWYNMFSVDFNSLKNVNSEVIGWIVWENDDISYPILYSGDNTKYLDTAFNGKKLDSGSIFLDGRNFDSFQDHHNILYGHNMQNMSMFGKLRLYKNDESYYEGHKYFQIILPDRVERYEVFSYNTVASDSIVFTANYASKSSFNEFMDYITLASYKQTGVEVTSYDKILTLSTCTSSDDLRFVVNAVMVDCYLSDRNAY